MKVKILFLDDIFSTLFRIAHSEDELVWDDNWVDSIEKALTDQNDRLDVNFTLVKSGEIENWKNLLDKEKPDIILMDLYWPEQARKKYGDHKKGTKISLDTLREMRKMYPDLPIIFYTILPDRKTLNECYENGATFFMEKISMAIPEVHNTLKYIIIYFMKAK
jgi:DNA-binding NarL/FixJ family response regulator